MWRHICLVRLVETVVDDVSNILFWIVLSVVRDDWQDQENFLVYKALRPVLASTQPPLQWILVAPIGPGGEPKLNVPNTFENTGLLY